MNNTSVKKFLAQNFSSKRRSSFVIYSVIIFLTIFCVNQLLIEPLVWGDYNLTTNQSEKIVENNFLYTWSDDSFGTTPRMSFSSVIPIILTNLPFFTDYLIYFFLRIFPLFLIPLVSFVVAYKLSKNTLISAIAAVLSIANPVIFADILNAQSLYIYPIVLLVFYYCVKIFFLHFFQLSNVLTLSLLFFLALGFLPPIIVPLIIVVMFFCIFSIPNIYRNNHLKKLFISILILFTVTSLLILPYILIANSGQQAHSAPSTISDYYHNYSKTQLLNVSRLAGNRGGGQETLGYNSPSLSNAAGYIFVLFLLIILFLKDSSFNYKIKSIRVASAATAILIMLFLHVLSVNTEFGEKLFNSQWITGTIRNPSKIFLILLQLEIVIVVISLQLLSLRMRRLTFNLLSVLVVCLFLIYAWPIFRGDMGLFYQIQKTERVVGTVIPEIVNKSNELNGRSLLMPVNHDDELRYEKLSTGLNTFRLGGSYPYTNEIQKKLINSFNENREEFFDYLNVLGIENVFLKKDDLFVNEKIPLFPVKNSYESSKFFLQSGLETISGSSSYILLKNNTFQSKIYSPTKLLSVSTEADIETIIGLSTYFNSTILSTTQSLSLFNEVSGCKNKVNCIFVNRNPNVVNLEFTTDTDLTSMTSTTSIFYTYSTTSKKLITTINSDIDELITINELPINKEIYNSNNFRSGFQKIIFYKIRNILETPIRFENLDQWPVGNASTGRLGESKIYTRIDDSEKIYKNSLVLGSGNHNAYIKVPLPTLESSKEYIVSFNYKNLIGKPLSYSIWQASGTSPLDYKTVQKNSEWAQYYINVKPQTTGSLHLYFYSDSWGSISENVINEVNVYEVINTEEKNIFIPSYAIISSTNYYQNDKQAPSDNLLSNAGFENANLQGWDFGNASLKMPGEPQISSSVSNTANNPFAVLKSSNHTAFLSQRIDNFDTNSSYKLSLSFKNISGTNPSFAIWQTGSELSSPAGKLTPSRPEWNEFEITFTPDSKSESSYLYLYTDSKNGEISENNFDDIRIQKISKIKSELELSKESDVKPSIIINSINEVNPTLYQIDVTGSNGAIVLNQSFHEGWSAYIYDSKEPINNIYQFFNYFWADLYKIDKNKHFLANGFANAWVIENIDLEGKTIILEFEPQRLFNLSLVISMTTFLGLVFFIVYSSINSKRVRIKKMTVDLKK